VEAISREVSPVRQKNRSQRRRRPGSCSRGLVQCLEAPAALRIGSAVLSMADGHRQESESDEAAFPKGSSLRGA
jgi:hypothetical protein